MELTEVPCGQQRAQKRAERGAPEMAEIMNVKLADPAKKQIRDGKIKKAPEHIDLSRGKSSARRLSKRALKRSPSHSTHRVRDGVGKKNASKQI
jgi:hypothetical protein